MLRLCTEEIRRARPLSPRLAFAAGSVSSPPFGNLRTFPLCNIPTVPRAIPFRIRTSEKCVPNPFGIRTSKTRHLKSFGMNTYKKTPGGRGLPTPELARANSRYTTGSMLSTTVLDTNWLGHPRSIAAVLMGSDGHRAIIDPGPASILPALRQHLDFRGSLFVMECHGVLLLACNTLNCPARPIYAF